MSEPPRRRRSAPPPRRASRGPSVLPTIALGIGVVVAGLGIGAFLSALQRSNGTTPYAVPSHGLAVVTPVAQPTRGPVALATFVSHAKPSPSPSPSTSPAPTPSSSASTSPTPAATAKPSATGKPSPKATASPKAPTFPPTAVAKPTAAATLGVVVRNTAVPAPTFVAVTRPATVPVHPFAAQAESTVRRYLDALIAGNEGGAYAAFGAAPGDPNVRLLEEGFIDRGTRIVSLRTTHADAAGATVEAELTSSRGSYLATYHLSGGPSGAVIDQHDYIRE